VLAVAILVVVLLGALSRRPFAPALVQAYVGDVLWGSLFFLLAAWLWPRATSVKLVVSAVLVTELIELSQLYQAPWVNQVRDTRLGGLLLGHGFSYSDMICVLIGALLAGAIDVWRGRAG
jgi:hypothetical protein